MTEIPATNELGSSGTTKEVHGSQPKPEIGVEAEYDSSYYFQEDPMAIFLVEKCLFRIHRHFLIKGSDVFRDMFASPAEGTGPEGTNNGQPILLPEVTKGEFKALLDYFYLPSHKRWQTKNRKENLQVYIDLLSISHRFLFDEVFQFAVEKLQSMINDIPTVQRFLLGERYDLKEWLFSAYESFLDSGATPTTQEFEILGFDKAARLMRARDAMRDSHLQEIMAKCKCTQEVEVPFGNTFGVSTFGGDSIRHGRHGATISTTTQVAKPRSKDFVKRFFEL